MLRRGAFIAALSCAFFPSISSLAATPSIAPWANRATVNSDGDALPDVNDIEPGLYDFGFDTDADGIGDDIDPTPTSSNPNLGDPGLGLYDPLPINAGNSLSIDYVMNLATPPGGWGYIDIDFGMDNVYDATWFGPLSTSIDTMTIPANLFTSASWDLNTPGIYTLQAKARAPGMQSEFESIITNVVVVPEPGMVGLALFGLAVLTRRSR